MTDARTVGDLDGDAAVLRLNNCDNVVHLPGADCSHLNRKDTTPKRKRAVMLWDDTAICPDCRDVPYRGTGEPETTLPTGTEVVAND